VVTCVYNFGEEAVEVPGAYKGKPIFLTKSTSKTLPPFGLIWMR
jgi:hypothetical protein